MVIGINGNKVEASDVYYVHLIKVAEDHYDLRVGLRSRIFGSTTLATYRSHGGAMAAMDELHRQLWEAQNGRGHGDILVANLPGNAAARIMREAE